MNASDQTKKDLYGETQAQRAERTRELRRRLLDKLQADPQGIWAELLQAIDEKESR